MSNSFAFFYFYIVVRDSGKTIPKKWPFKIQPNETLEGPAGLVTVNEEGIITTRMHEGLDLKLETAQAMVAFMKNITNNTPYYVRAISGNFLTIDRETRHYLRSPEVQRNRKAVAMVLVAWP